MISPVFRKTLVVFYLLTVVLTIASLGMFFIEKPYYGETKCANPIAAHEAAFNNIGNPGGCTHTDPKDPSALMRGLINLTLIVGAIFVILSIVAFNDKRLHPEDYPVTVETEHENEDENEDQDESNI